MAEEKQDSDQPEMKLNEAIQHYHQLDDTIKSVQRDQTRLAARVHNANTAWLEAEGVEETIKTAVLDYYERNELISDAPSIDLVLNSVDFMKIEARQTFISKLNTGAKFHRLIINFDFKRRTVKALFRVEGEESQILFTQYIDKQLLDEMYELMMLRTHV